MDIGAAIRGNPGSLLDMARGASLARRMVGGSSSRFDGSNRLDDEEHQRSTASRFACVFHYGMEARCGSASVVWKAGHRESGERFNQRLAAQ
jgi:hypothetical protein